MENVIKEITQRPILTTSIVLAGLSVILFSLGFYFYHDNPEEYFKSVLVEAHGMIFDLLIIGILLFWLNKKGEKHIRIRNYINEIDDFRHWRSEEAAFRILGNIKRLNRLGIHKLDLHKCYIHKINLGFANLESANFNYAEMHEINLLGANLEHARLNQANLEKACLNKAKLKNSFLCGANLSSTSAVNADFTNSMLIKADLSNAYMINANFTNADLSGATFDNASLYLADLSNVKGLTVDQLSKAKNLYKTKLDDEMMEKMKKYYPQLLENNYKSIPAGVQVE